MPRRKLWMLVQSVRSVRSMGTACLIGLILNMLRGHAVSSPDAPLESQARGTGPIPQGRCPPPGLVEVGPSSFPCLPKLIAPEIARDRKGSACSRSSGLRVGLSSSLSEGSQRLCIASAPLPDSDTEKIVKREPQRSCSSCLESICSPMLKSWIVKTTRAGKWGGTNGSVPATHGTQASL